MWHDDELLQNEPGNDDPFADYEYPPCIYCEAETRPDGGCPECNPMEVLASFRVVDGKVTEVIL